MEEDEEEEGDRRDSGSSTSGQLWSREQGQSRMSSLSPVIAAASSRSYTEKLDTTVTLDATDDDDSEDNEFTFNSPTSCIDGLQEDTLSGVKSRHSMSHSKRSSINFAFSPPAKRRPASEMKSRKTNSPTAAVNSIPMAKFDDKPVSAPAAAAGANSLWARAMNTVKCEVCLVPNDKGATKCVACESALGAVSVATKPASSFGSITAQQKTDTTKAAPAAAAAGNSLWAKALNTVKCEVCLVPNEKGATNCVACESALGSVSVASTKPALSCGSTTAQQKSSALTGSDVSLSGSSVSVHTIC
jgi:hypothetical protein